MKKMTKWLALVLAAVVLCTGCAAPAQEIAASQKPQTPQKQAAPEEFVSYPTNVTWELTQPEAWELSDAVLITPEEIRKVNQANARMTSVETQMYTLEELAEQATGDELRWLLNYFAERAQDREGYIGGERLPQSYWDDLVANANVEAVPDVLNVQYGYSVVWGNTKMYPTTDFAGEDPEDLFFDTTLCSECHPFQPLVVLHESADGAYWFVFLNGFGGWVPKEFVALCADKEEWLARQEMEDFLVVTGSILRLPDDEGCPELSGQLVPMGTKMKLVKLSDAPKVISDRCYFGNFVVSLPVRGENGMVEDRYCLVPASADVSVGFLPCTSRNLVELALKRAGDRYGWGGLGHTTDCCGLAKEIYACFGFELPRGVGQQGGLEAVTRYTLTEEMSEEARLDILRQVPSSSILCFPGHIMLYLGMQNGVPYCISAVGSFAQEDDESLTILSTNTVNINTLNVKRRSGLTWLQCLTSVVAPTPAAEQ